MDTDRIFETATSDEGMNRKERALFHLFNPNGAYSLHRKALDEAFEAIAEGRARPGIILAYDAEWFYKNLLKLSNRKKGGSCWDTQYYIHGIKDQTKKLRKAIEEDQKAD